VEAIYIEIFRYQGQEEDHYTNILMSILSIDNYSLTENFLKALIPQETIDFQFENLHISTRSKYCPHDHKEYEYIIGIAPFQKAIKQRNEFEHNTGSIPDAWICGKNFNLLFEFKIRGTLDESQIAAHQKLLSKENKVIELSWTNVLDALTKVHNDKNPVQSYLIKQFLVVSNNFKSKRKSSGMPTQIIGAKVNPNEIYFIITGSKNIKEPYVVELVIDGKKEEIKSDLKGIQEARRWIAHYVIDNKNNKNNLPIKFDGMNSEITDLCVVPGRKKNKWNQWRLGSFLNL